MKEKIESSIKLHPDLKEILSEIPDYYDLLSDAVNTGDFSKVEERLKKLIAEDTYMQETGTEEGARYYKPFHQAAVPKILEALKRDLSLGKLPTITLTFGEIDKARNNLRFAPFKSQQDVLYGFSSERYKKWGPSLTSMGFSSACMSGEAEVYLTMAPRYLSLKEEPDETITEILGGISADFWQTMGAVFGNPHFNAVHDLNQLREETDKEVVPSDHVSRKDAAKNLELLIEKLSEQGKLSGVLLKKAEFILRELKEENPKLKPGVAHFFKEGSEMSQEQIGLKYADEGKYLQKLLGGKRVEHLQSNVKMIKNILRGNKCEVDSIYRVLSEKKIILLEAKGKDSVSRGQLYQLYETFKLKLPSDWDLSVVILLLGKSDGVTVIDMAEVQFNEQLFGQITESLCAMKKKKHYRWLIKQPEKP